MPVAVMDTPPIWAASKDVNGTLEPQYSARIDRMLVASIFGEGVHDTTGGELLVRERAAGANMSVEVDPGRCVVSGDDMAYQGRYLMRLETIVNLGVDPAPAAGLSRIDRVIVKVYDTSINSADTSRWEIQVLTGEAVSGTPVAPDVPPTAISLARIGPITDTTAAITNAMITDERAPSTSTILAAFDPPSPTDPPSSYPRGYNYGTVLASDGWPDTGTLETVKRSNLRVVQRLTRSETDYTSPAIVYTRQGRSDPDGWGPWTLATRHVAAELVGANETTTSTMWTNLTTMGPSVSRRIGPTGRALVTVSALSRNITAGERAYMGFEVFGGSTQAPGDDRALTVANTTYQQMSFQMLVEGLAPGVATFTAKYRVTGGTGYWQNRRITVDPA